MTAYEMRISDWSSDLCSSDLMTVPGVGQVTALAFRATIDDPTRFKSASDVAVYLGLIPRRYQSGEQDYHARISKRGHSQTRLLLVQARKGVVQGKRVLLRVVSGVCRIIKKIK